MDQATCASRAAALASVFFLLSGETCIAQREQDQTVCTTQRDLDASVGACTRVLEQEQREAIKRLIAALRNRAAALVSNGNVAAAMADLNEMIDLDPKFSAAYGDRADIYRAAGRCDEAISDYSKVIETTAPNSETHVGRGICRLFKGEEEPGMADLDAAIRLDAANRDGAAVRAWTVKGRYHVAKGDVDRAVAEFDAAIKLDPRNAAVYLDRAAALVAKGDRDGALASVEQAIKLDVNNATGLAAQAWRAKAAIHILKNEVDSAIADYDEAIKLDPRSVASYIGRATVWAGKGDAERAIVRCRTRDR